MAQTEETTLPSGTVTFLLTDIENSSGQWERDPEAMRDALAHHDRLIAEAVVEHDGAVVKHLGDGCWAAFASAPKAVDAAIAFHSRHQREAPAIEPSLRVRIGLHSGDVEPTEGDYFGPVINRAARVVDLANGDQIVCSSSTAGLLPDADLRSEGRHELRGIGDDEIFMVLADGLLTDPQPLRRPIRPTNLPKVLTSFLGRSEDVSRTVALIGQGESIVTLLGPGGVGKTRLAVEVGAQISAAFDEHVHFCDLVPLADGDADAVGEAIAEIVGARRQPGMTLVESIADYLAGRPSLLIIDNCEHVIDAVREMVETLSHADSVHVLATSREVLGLPGEQQVIIEPLGATEGGIELFVDRARHRDPSFELNEETSAGVSAVVERLDGMPLAIELAAARIRLMSPAELAKRLEDGFRVLGKGAGRSRHGTLVDTVRWSYDLLPADEAALFNRLCSFAGGFDLDAVEAVCADGEVVDAFEVPDLLMALVDKSMVVSTMSDGHRRFTLLETLRAFASEQLTMTGELDHYRREHADHYLGVARCQADRFFSAAEPDAWRVMDDEWTNFRMALDTYRLGGDLDRAADLVIALFWYGTVAMRFEIFTWADELLETPGIEEVSGYTDLCGASALGAYFTTRGDAVAMAERGLAADAGDPEGLCHIALSSVAMNNQLSPEVCDAATSAGLAADPTTVGGRLWAEGFRVFYLCTYDPSPEAAEHVANAVRLADETGSPTARAITDWARGQVVSFEDMDRGLAVMESARDRCRSLPGDHIVEQIVAGLILHLTVRKGDLLGSLQGCRDAVQGALDSHYHSGTSHLFGVTAIALARAGDPATGARLVGSMAAHGHQTRRNATRTLEEALGDDLTAHLDRGHDLSITEAAHVALVALDAAIERVTEEERA